MVRRLDGGLVLLTGVAGEQIEIARAQLLADPAFAIVASQQPLSPLPPRGQLDALPTSVANQAQWWEEHLIEVLHGRSRDAPPGARPRLEYDPERTSMRQREIAKVAELSGSGVSVSLRGLQRRRRAYEREGLLGLVDGRSRRAAGHHVDERVVNALRRAIAEQTSASTGTVERVRRRVGQILQTEHDVDPDAVMPSRATFYRLVERLSAGRHTFGSAATRRSLAQRPDGPFSDVAALRPGEWVLTDSTPIDVRVVLDDGTVDRAELTWMLDLATRSLPAAVLRPTTKTVDASLLLARCLTPEPMRPGWSDALRLSRSVLPFRRLVELDARLEHAAARPVIAPETVVCDHGSVYMSASFRAACRALGISHQPTHAGCPWEKGEVERSFASMATLFAQYVKGYVGRSVDRRGKNADAEAAWSITELQALLDEWIVAHWQNRPHDGLRHPLTPGRAMTPNEMYAALLEVAGYVPLPLTGDDYIELLPLKWRSINAYGIKIDQRRYDAVALNPYRRQHSGVAAQRGRWEVHYDPYDVTRVWVRNHHDGGWITAHWSHLSSAPAPFGEQAWRQAQRMLARRGDDPTQEAGIAAAVATLLDKAEAGIPVERLAALSGNTTVLLNQRIEEWRPVPSHLPARIWPSNPACALCMATRGVTHLVVVHREVEEVVCRKHGRWLGDTDGLAATAQPSLRAHPEILAASAAHRRMISRYSRRFTDATYVSAYDVCATWRSHGDFDEHVRALLWRFHPVTRQVRQSDPTVEAASYPQVIAVMRTLTLPALRELPFSPGGTETFVEEVRRTAAPGYRWNAARSYGRGDPLIELYASEAQRRRAGHPPRAAGDPPSTAEALDELASAGDRAT